LKSGYPRVNAPYAPQLTRPFSEVEYDLKHPAALKYFRKEVVPTMIEDVVHHTLLAYGNMVTISAAMSPAEVARIKKHALETLLISRKTFGDCLMQNLSTVGHCKNQETPATRAPGPVSAQGVNALASVQDENGIKASQSVKRGRDEVESSNNGSTTDHPYKRAKSTHDQQEQPRDYAAPEPNLAAISSFLEVQAHSSQDMAVHIEEDALVGSVEAQNDNNTNIEEQKLEEPAAIQDQTEAAHGSGLDQDGSVCAQNSPFATEVTSQSQHKDLHQQVATDHQRHDVSESSETLNGHNHTAQDSVSSYEIFKGFLGQREGESNLFLGLDDGTSEEFEQGLASIMQDSGYHSAAMSADDILETGSE
jgi:hypothetical protein